MKKVIKIITSIILVLILLVLLYFILCVNKVDEYSEYSREWLQQEINRTPLLVFPEATNDNVLSSDYLYYKNLNLLLSNDYQVYLEIKYNDADFESEKERLASIEKGDEYSDFTIDEDILYDEINYKYPAYVAVRGDDEEYALIDDENKRIIYVYMTVAVMDIKFDTQYLPQYYTYLFDLREEKIDSLMSYSYVEEMIDTLQGDYSDDFNIYLYD